MQFSQNAPTCVHMIGQAALQLSYQENAVLKLILPLLKDGCLEVRSPGQYSEIVVIK